MSGCTFHLYSVSWSRPGTLFPWRSYSPRSWWVRKAPATGSLCSIVFISRMPSTLLTSSSDHCPQCDPWTPGCSLGPLSLCAAPWAPWWLCTGVTPHHPAPCCPRHVYHLTLSGHLSPHLRTCVWAHGPSPSTHQSPSDHIWDTPMQGYLSAGPLHHLPLWPDLIPRSQVPGLSILASACYLLSALFRCLEITLRYI